MATKASKPAENHDTLTVEISNSPRVRAALNLSEAIKDLAAVIRGHVAQVTIQNCNFKSEGETPGLSVVQKD